MAVPLEVVRAILLDSSNQVILTKRLSNETAGGMYCLPGGKLEPGETSEEAMRRELEEELGLFPIPLILHLTDTNSNPDWISHYYYGKAGRSSEAQFHPD